ncbi:acyl-CoA thioesterase II [Salinisphaera orenii]|uniref:Acyl-CoA thioesterase 2 n=1 Tax=Salinisphaera orenii YIM 95161 TaxID=1051139 RepID=A0A423PPF1_9GAMM|nr:acyl-CoA thioesterase II [Salinisphaera halophila]ROO27475.1 acyl-CoA thioesterase [Salinisphaera halophila YIM 95161]
MPSEGHHLVQDLLDQLDLEALEQRLFRGSSRDLGGKSVFGGQVAGQAMVAATRTVDPAFLAHSMHGYFLRPGDMGAAIVYEVDNIRDGRSFATRRVQAIQHGRPIFSMLASFHVEESGYTHQMSMPDVADPEDLASHDELRHAWVDALDRVPESLREAVGREVAIDMRPVRPWNMLDPDKREAEQHVWLRAKAPLPDDQALHRAVLTYASDFNLLATSLFPHGVSFFSPGMQMASIDHALWFHREFAVDDWLLYSMDSPGAQDARGLARGLIFNRAGELVASVVQEGLIRQREQPR